MKKLLLSFPFIFCACTSGTESNAIELEKAQSDLKRLSEEVHGLFEAVVLPNDTYNMPEGIDRSIQEVRDIDKAFQKLYGINNDSLDSEEIIAVPLIE